MKFILSFVVTILVGVNTASAYELIVTEVERPYEIVSIDSDMTEGQAFLGELQDFPVMYEVQTDESLQLSMDIRQRYYGSSEPDNLSLIIVSVDEDGGGVTEVARLRPESEDWVTIKDSEAGMTFWQSEALSQLVEPGIYRIEISTPSNIAKYLLTFGNEEKDLGYLESISDSYRMQKFFGYSFFRILSASPVYYTLGLLLLLFGVGKFSKYRKMTTHI